MGLDQRVAKASKRVPYPVVAFIEINHAKQPVEIRNISKTGIQFFSGVPVPSHTPIRLTWKDPKMGNVESTLEIVRRVAEAGENLGRFGYGSKFVHVQTENRKNLNRVVETTEELERKGKQQAIERMSLKTVSEVMTQGRVYLRNLLRGVETSGSVGIFSKDIKEYERKAFDRSDETGQWIQKLVTQYFHCRILLALFQQPFLKIGDVAKLMNEKLRSIDLLIEECNAFAQLQSQSLDKKQLEQSLRRLTFSKTELSETVEKRVHQSAKSLGSKEEISWNVPGRAGRMNS